MLRLGIAVALIATPLALAVSSQSYNWANVQIRGGGFVPNIIFNPSKQGLAYARTDIGGAYRLNSDGSTWTPMLDWVNNTYPNMWGVDALATDPVDTSRVYIVCNIPLCLPFPRND
jgi:xyloglucan-specific exo-beta-1,4-glucanase